MKIPPPKSASTVTASAAPGAPPAVAASGSYISVHRIEGRLCFDPGSSIPPNAFSEAELTRLISVGAVVATEDYVDPPRPGSLSPDSATRFVGTFLRASVDLRVEPLNGDELQVPKGRVFFCALNVAEGAWRAQLAEPAGAPGEKDASAIFALKRGDDRALFRDWSASAGLPFTTCATGFAVRIRKAPEPLSAAPPILVGAAPLAVAAEPPLPAGFTAHPRRLD